jgi:hypothetical protein
MPAIGDRSHARSLRRTPPIQQAVFLTVPARRIIHKGQHRARRAAILELGVLRTVENYAQFEEISLSPYP